MDKIRIYPILEYILNEADTDDLAAIKEALKRREKQQAFGGVNIQNVARQTGRSIEEQVGASVESIRDMIRNYAVQIIKGQAPEIGDEQLETLLESWIPDPGKKSRGGQSAGDIPFDNDSPVYCLQDREYGSSGAQISCCRDRRLASSLLEQISGSRTQNHYQVSE